MVSRKGPSLLSQLSCLTLSLPSAMCPPRHRLHVSSLTLRKSQDSQSMLGQGDPAIHIHIQCPVHPDFGIKLRGQQLQI